jgi:hypothetical protein
MVGHTSTTFWQKLNSTPNSEFEKGVDEYAVIKDLDDYLG